MQSALKVEGNFAPPLSGEYQHNLELFCIGGLSLFFHLYIYPIYLYCYILLDIYCIVYNMSVLFINFAFHIWLVSVSFFHTPILLLLRFIFNFLTLQDALGSCYICLASALESVISSRSPGLFVFFWRVTFEAKIWVLGVLVVTWLSSILGPLSRYSEKVCVGTLYCVYNYIYKYFYM